MQSDDVEALVARWSLVLERRFPEGAGLADNFVAAARRVDGTRCVLKVSPHRTETRSEVAALRAFDGHGAARLLEADAEVGALLLERIEPGTMLAEARDVDDARATRIAAEILPQLWRCTSDDADLRPLESWLDTYARNRDRILTGVTEFPRLLFERADAIRAELLASTADPVVVHGDLHHFNILRSDRAGWLSIDPKGLHGDRYFDLCQFLKNPVPVPPVVNRRRLEIFCEELNLDPLRARQWCLVHAVLDALWSFEEGSNWWKVKLAYAEQTPEF